MSNKTLFISAAVIVGIIAGITTLYLFKFQESFADRLTPELACKKFMEALNDYDYAEAKKYATEETIKMLEILENLGDLGVDPNRNEELLSSVSCNVTGDKATCKTCCGANGEQSEDITLHQDRNGHWKVHMSKEGF